MWRYPSGDPVVPDLGPVTADPLSRGCINDIQHTHWPRGSRRSTYPRRLQLINLISTVLIQTFLIVTFIKTSQYLLKRSIPILGLINIHLHHFLDDNKMTKCPCPQWYGMSAPIDKHHIHVSKPVDMPQGLWSTYLVNN